MKKIISCLIVLFLLNVEESQAVFDDYLGQEITFRCKGALQSGNPHTFLDANTTSGGNGAVYLSPLTGTDAGTGVNYSGTHWRIEGNHPDGEGYSFTCLGHIQNPQFRFLDGNTMNGQVKLSPHRGKAGGTHYSGTRWKPHPLSDGSYAFECLGHLRNSNHKFLTLSGGAIRLTANMASPAARWEVEILQTTLPAPLPREGGAAARFPTALELDATELQRCLTACQSTKLRDLVAEGRQYWTNPTVRTFGGQTGSHEAILDRHYTDFGIFIAEGPRVVIAFPGTDFFKPSDVFSDAFCLDWNLQTNSDASDGRVDIRFKHDRIGGTSEDIPGRCHRGFLGVYKSTSGQLRKMLDSYWGEAGLAGPEDLQITCTGHSLGGAVAQLASVDIVNHLYFNGNYDTSLFNARNNVTVVTFGSPPLFNQTAQHLWNKNWRRENHLRIFRETDRVPIIYPQLVGWRTVFTKGGEFAEKFASGSWEWVATTIRFTSQLFRQVRQEKVNYAVFQAGTPRFFEAGGRTGLIEAHVLSGYIEDFEKWASQ